jgi:hypothetical protein
MSIYNPSRLKLVVGQDKIKKGKKSRDEESESEIKAVFMKDRRAHQLLR